MALPGVSTVLKDRFYTLTRTDAPAGPRVLAIAPRDTADGTVDTQGNHVPDYDPYSPRSEADAIAAFGEGSGCHRAYLELTAGGSVSPVLVALPMATTDTGLYSNTVLDGAFDAAETARPDIIVPWGRGGHPGDWESLSTPSNPNVGFAADNTSGANNLAQKVASKCKLISDRSHPVFAVMGVKPFGATGTGAENMTAANVTSHLGLSTLPDHNGVGFTDGQYLTVVATEVNVAGYPRNDTDRNKAGAFGYSNGAALYAGFLSQLQEWTAPTGKVAFNVLNVRYNPTRPQQQDMIDKGVVPVTLDYNRVPIWVDGRTFAKDTSDYVRQTTLRIAFSAVLGTRQTAQKFIGEAATLQNRNALDTAVRSMLRGMQQLGAITDSDFVINYLPRENKAIIDLVLRPVFELRNIEIQISVDL